MGKDHSTTSPVGQTDIVTLRQSTTENNSGLPGFALLLAAARVFLKFPSWWGRVSVSPTVFEKTERAFQSWTVGRDSKCLPSSLSCICMQGVIWAQNHVKVHSSEVGDTERWDCLQGSRLIGQTPRNGGEEFTRIGIFCLHSPFISVQQSPKLQLLFVSFIRRHYSSLFCFLQVEGLSHLW